jgi:murein DD-endopeptidase MepM/ murein hydrolase activator NlpD
MPDAGGPPDGADCRRPWVEPVDAAVVDPFRPPDRVYGPGNRGIEYGVEPGQPVVAVDGGVVAFAGPVAGSPVVVIDHGGGLRSSFVHLADRSVGRGEVVSRGRAIGSAGPGFHLGARVGGRYIDPAELVDRRCEVVRLVPP